jgi:hypothetical protein
VTTIGAAIVFVGSWYFAAQCVHAALRSGDTAWTVGYWVFAILFAALGLAALVLSISRINEK